MKRGLGILVGLAVIYIIIFGLPQGQPRVSVPSRTPNAASNTRPPTREPQEEASPEADEPTAEASPMPSFAVPGQFIFTQSVLFRRSAWLVTEGTYVFNFPTATYMEKTYIPFSFMPEGWQGQVSLATVYKEAVANAQIVPGVRLFDEDGKPAYTFEADQANNTLTLYLRYPIQIFSARAYNVRYTMSDKSLLSKDVDEIQLLNFLSANVDKRVKELACVDTDPVTGMTLRDETGKTAMEVAQEVLPETLRNIVAGFYTGQMSPKIEVVIEDAGCYVLADPEPPEPAQVGQ